MATTKINAMEPQSALPTMAPPEKGTRTIRIQSPSGHVHVLTGFKDDHAPILDIAGLPEDEWGHWDKGYDLTVNGQPVVLDHIARDFEEVDDGKA